MKLARSLIGELVAKEPFVAEYLHNPSPPLQGARAITAYGLRFPYKYLKGSTDSMPALKDYPRVINFKQK